MVDSVVVLAAATAERWSTFVLLFLSQVLAWAGVPAIGAAAIATAGVLASQGTIHLWAVIVVGTAGAEIGGLIGWQLGHRVARVGSGRTGRMAKKRDTALESGEKIEAHWGRLIVFFVPSWVSGALGMPFHQFAFWNVWASLLWVLSAGLGAYGIGSAASSGLHPGAIASLLVAAAAVAAIAYAYVLWRRHRRGRALEDVPLG